MIAILDKDEKAYGVLLTASQEIGFVKIASDEDIFQCGRRAIGCEWIELVEPKHKNDGSLIMLIDEEGKLREGEKFVNCVGSFLYDTQSHGDTIVGNAMIVRQNEENLEMLTGREAIKLAKELAQLRVQAIETILKAVNLSLSSRLSLEMKLRIVQEKGTHRQPCKPNQVER